jgi:hypothetical protein
MQDVHDSYRVFVRGANGFKSLGWHDGTPEDLFEEIVQDEIDDSLGEFVEAMFRRGEGLRDIYYRPDGTWSEGEVYVTPEDSAAKLLREIQERRAEN